GPQRPAQLATRADPQLREHLAQVVLDRAGADEELTADLRDRVAVRGQRGDLRLLRGEQVPGVDAPGAGGAAGRDQLSSRPIREGAGAEPFEHVVCGAEVDRKSVV